MANGNTGAGRYLAFPTFGGGGGGGGITQVKLPAAQMRFPTARGPVRRAPEPTLKETLAPFLPIALEGIGSLLKKDPEPMARDDYLTSIGADLEDPTKLQTAQADAYELFGDPKEKDGFGFDDVLSMVIGSQMGRGAKDYAATSRAIDKANETSRLTTETNRATFIKQRMADDAFQQLNLIHVPTARLGVPDIRPGYFDKTTGENFVKDPDHPDANNRGFRVAEEDWINHSAFASGSNTAVDVFKNPFFIELSKTDAELSAREQAVGSFLNVANPTVTALKESVANPETAPTTFFASLATIGTSAFTNFEQIASLNGNRSVTEIFDPQSGNAMQQLYLALDKGDDEGIKQATTDFEYSTGLDLRKLMGNLSYDNISIRANFLQMAYMAAAANGQTGRTLSDKDLAYHLQIIGYGSSQDPEILYNNILRFGDSLVTGLDTETQLGIPKNGFQRYNMEDPYAQATITRFYTPSMTKNDKGKEIPDWLNYNAYTYIPFLKRSAGVGNIDEWMTHEGTYYNDRTKIRGGFSSNTSSETVNSSTFVDDDLDAFNDLYD